MIDIFITDLSAYNQGHLVGRWIRLPLSSFELSQALSEVLTEGEHITSESNHEEYFITDYEWSNIDIKDVDEYDNIHDLNAEVQLLSALDSYKLKPSSFCLMKVSL